MRLPLCRSYFSNLTTLWSGHVGPRPTNLATRSSVHTSNVPPRFRRCWTRGGRLLVRPGIQTIITVLVPPRRRYELVSEMLATTSSVAAELLTAQGCPRPRGLPRRTRRWRGRHWERRVAALRCFYPCFRQASFWVIPRTITRLRRDFPQHGASRAQGIRSEPLVYPDSDTSNHSARSRRRRADNHD